MLWFLDRSGKINSIVFHNRVLHLCRLWYFLCKRPFRLSLLFLAVLFLRIVPSSWVHSLNLDSQLLRVKELRVFSAKALGQLDVLLMRVFGGNRGFEVWEEAWLFGDAGVWELSGAGLLLVAGLAQGGEFEVLGGVSLGVLGGEGFKGDFLALADLIEVFDEFLGFVDYFLWVFWFEHNFSWLSSLTRFS